MNGFTNPYSRPQRSSYNQNPWVSAIARMIAEKQSRPQLAPETGLAERDAAISELRTMPDMPYLEGLSPMGRYKDMFYRGQGRAAQAGDSVRELAANQGLIEDAAIGVTRQPNGSLTTTEGAIIEHPAGPLAPSVLTSKYGTGSSVRSSREVPHGTFSFKNALGETVTAPFSRLQDPRFMKMMREEEVAASPAVARARKEREAK